MAARMCGCCHSRCTSMMLPKRRTFLLSISVSRSLGYQLPLNCALQRVSTHQVTMFAKRYSSKQEGKKGGFFSGVLENIRKGYERDRALQESLKGFREEREKLEKSYFVNNVRDRLSGTQNHVKAALVKILEGVQKGWTLGREQVTEFSKKAASTEVGRKSQDIGAQIAKTAQQTAEKVSEQAAKTEAFKTVSKGATIVKEDLLDDIIKESAPYQSPEKLQKRSELGGNREAPSDVIAPNETTKDVVVKKQSRWDRWNQQWVDLRQNNRVTNAFYSAKMKYDESDNIIIRASRVVTDRVGDALSGTVTQSDMAQTLAEIRKVDPRFVKEDFVRQCQSEIIPTVLDAFLKGDLNILQDWCHEAAFNVLAAVIKQRIEPGVKIVRCKVLEVSDVDVVMAKMLDIGPVLVLTFQAQQLTVKSMGLVNEEILENIFYVWALCRDQTIYNPKAAWKVVEFGIQSAGKLLV